MRSVRALLPRVSTRRTWGPDGRPLWEFRFGPRPLVVPPTSHLAPSVRSRSDDGRRDVPRVVRSRGVRVGDDELLFAEFHYGYRRPGAGRAQAGRPAGGPAGRHGDPDGDQAASRAVATALARLAADPGQEHLNARVLAALAADGFEPVPAHEVCAAMVGGGGAARCLDGVFVWRAEGLRGSVTYLVAPEPSVRDLLEADPVVVQAVVRAACPLPDDAVGDLESGLREAIVRLAVVAADPHRRAAARGRDAGEVVLEVGPGSAAAADPLVIDDAALDDATLDHTSLTTARSQARRALSAELADLARKVGTASVRPASEGYEVPDAPGAPHDPSMLSTHDARA